MLRCSRLAQVHAFEPTPAARAWLEECVAENRIGNVSVSDLALGDHAGRAQLVDHDFSHKEGAQNRISATDAGIPIEVITLDAYAEGQGFDAIRFWKLDTEGHELPALLGAQSLLRREAIDYVYIETSDAGAEIAKMLATFGYVAMPLALDRVLTIADVTGKFSNLFVSRRVAQAECGRPAQRD